MRNTSSKLNLLEKVVPLGREFAQGVLKVLFAEPGAAKQLDAFDGGAAAITGCVFCVWANDRADRRTVLAHATRPPPVAVTVGQALLRRRPDRVRLKGAVLLDGLVDGRGGQRGSAEVDAIWLGTLVVHLRRLDARDKEIVGERGGGAIGRGSGSHGDARA